MSINYHITISSLFNEKLSDTDISKITYTLKDRVDFIEVEDGKIHINTNWFKNLDKSLNLLSDMLNIEIEVSDEMDYKSRKFISNGNTWKLYENK